MRTHADFSAATRQSGASPVRIEHDLLGEHAVPAAALYGIHTARALANFDITGDTLARYPLLIQALAAVKQAAAAANATLRPPGPDHRRGDHQTPASGRRCREHHHQFGGPHRLQGGELHLDEHEREPRSIANLGHRAACTIDRGRTTSCTHSNMSTSGRAPTTCTRQRSRRPGRAVGEVLETLRNLRQAFEDKAAELVTTVKLGRTQLQDAVPMTLGQEFNAFAGTLARTRPNWTVPQAAVRAEPRRYRNRDGAQLPPRLPNARARGTARASPASRSCTPQPTSSNPPRTRAPSSTCPEPSSERP